MKRKDIIHTQIPLEQFVVARRRYQGIVRHLGRFLEAPGTFESLCLSLYTQGLFDGVQICESGALATDESDYQI